MELILPISLKGRQLHSSNSVTSELRNEAISGMKLNSLDATCDITPNSLIPHAKNLTNTRTISCQPVLSATQLVRKRFTLECVQYPKLLGEPYSFVCICI